MGVYTKISKRELSDVAADYGLPRVTGVRPFAEESVNTHLVLETGKGKFHVKIAAARSELELKREFDLLVFLRKHGFPCPVPIADRRGRHYRDWEGQSLSLCRWVDGHFVDSEDISPGQLESVGRMLADLHMIGRAYKKGVDNRFAFDRVADIYRDARGRVPHYFKRIVRALDEELDYLAHYLESKLPKGVIHGELFQGDIKFKGDKVVLVLDFDGSARGKFIFDLANAVNAMCFDGGRYVPRRFEALLAGYESTRTLSLAEWDAFPNELRFSAFRCAVTRLRDFFLYPEDRERINKDFQNFYDRLLILRREREGGMEPMLLAMATGYDYRKYQRVKAVEKRSGR